MAKNEINNSHHCKQEVNATDWIATLMPNTLAQMESQFEAKLNKQQKHMNDLAEKGHEHEYEMEREDDIHSIHFIHEENPSLMKQSINNLE